MVRSISLHLLRSLPSPQITHTKEMEPSIPTALFLIVNVLVILLTIPFWYKDKNN